ncbi:MAG: hypothetical protein WCH39_00520 [Schlesneria sp.]
MFPKLVSGTSGKLRENKGDGMAEMSERQLRQAFFDLFAIKSNEKAVRKWGQDRIQHLEEQNKAMLGVFSQKELRIASLESHLNDRNETIDRLEEEIQRLNNQLLGKSTSQESDEDRHQRRRRERMLDEVTLICVRYRIGRMGVGETENTMWGRNSRDIAENICHGINDFDAKH